MNDNTRLIMFSRSYGCPFVSTAKQVLHAYGVEYEEIYIDHHDDARQKVRDWTGFDSVPTLIIAHENEYEPLEEPEFLARGASPRGIDRGYMLTEPSGPQLKHWLQKHHMIRPLEESTE